MDVESLKAWFRRVDWRSWLEHAGFLMLGLLGVGIVLSIVVAVFIGIPAVVILIVVGVGKAGYVYLSNLDPRYYYAVAFIVFILYVLLLFRRIGLISLSSQSMAHRRNLFFAFFLVFLIENFNLDVAAMFKASNDQINEAAKGILAFFALYSFVEYAHNLLFDYLRSRNESKITDNNEFLRGPKLVDLWLIFIGNYRFLFDFALPITTSLFIFIIYTKDIKVVFGIGETYFSEQVSTFVNKPENAEFKNYLDVSLDKSQQIAADLGEVASEAESVTKELYKTAKDKLSRISE